MTARSRPNEADPRVQRTRELIRNAFVDLLEEMDLEKITVNRIAERAKINRVTFYLHYRDIPDMIDKIADDIMKEMKEALEKGEAELEMRKTDISDDRTHSTVFVRMLEYIERNAKLFKLMLATKRVPAFTDRFHRMTIEQLSARIEQRFANQSAPSVPADISTWYLYSAHIGTIVIWLQHDMPYRPQYLADQMMRLTPRLWQPEGEI
ncbi:TetR/AcrR family transcriptional regulator [Cohnella lubricantis]|uniref:TetR/AcrR family transcriptional regulator n=1 Tax=Cohnella lubricantis TaxID=2163172 RepID=A0A841THR2_9BACL|nr:TetR/AcrR family transcriptional regulator [Cohnella lubricantis]MBB6678001.1 TetR/AcrR family transcriptional regulator [Cohnella lubricantis]MBP2118166.1 AcrR family transcriptional regulator [Cohnella lubricantis]